VIERPTNFGHAFGPESGLDAVEHLERRRLCSRVSREAVRGYERIVEEEVMREIATRSFTPAGVGSGAERQSVDRLRRHPQLLRLVNEADAGGSELRQVTIFEGQRTRSTIEASLRRAKKRIRLGDCALPEGTHVMVNSHLAHESEESFPDAGSFVPIPRQQCVREHGDGRRPAHAAARISFRATGIGGVGPQALYPPRSAARARTTDTISPPLWHAATPSARAIGRTILRYYAGSANSLGATAISRRRELPMARCSPTTGGLQPTVQSTPDLRDLGAARTRCEMWD
jgi:hypothetical protein